MIPSAHRPAGNVTNVYGITLMSDLSIHDGPDAGAGVVDNRCSDLAGDQANARCPADAGRLGNADLMSAGGSDGRTPTDSQTETT